MKFIRLAALYGTTLSLMACASTPMGPTVQTLPAQGKPFEQFQMEQASCKQYADEQVRGQAEAANSTGVLEGVGGTLLGAGLGAAIGGGRGAAIGAAGGAVAGTGVGASTSGHQERGIQTQYNNAYVQCMVAKGNQVERPVVYTPPSTTVIYNTPPAVVYAPPQPTVVYTAPPPPPGYYAPPPHY